MRSLRKGDGDRGSKGQSREILYWWSGGDGGGGGGSAGHVTDGYQNQTMQDIEERVVEELRAGTWNWGRVWGVRGEPHVRCAEGLSQLGTW